MANCRQLDLPLFLAADGDCFGAIVRINLQLTVRCQQGGGQIGGQGLLQFLPRDVLAALQFKLHSVNALGLVGKTENPHHALQQLIADGRGHAGAKPL